MKKVCIIGSPATQGNYIRALQKAGCDTFSAANFFRPLLCIEKWSDSFDGLLLPGGGDVPHSISCAKPLCSTEMPTPAMPSCSVSTSMTLDSGQFTKLGIKQFTALSLEQLAALDIFFHAGKPVMGICKGMQLINLYFHGTIGEVPDRKLHQHPNRDIFHPAENLPGTFMHALFGADMTVNSSHHQCIETLGENLQAIQFGPNHTIEALTHLSAPIFGTQWHPERMPENKKPKASLLFQYFVSFL